MGGGITNLRRNAFTLIELLAIIVILAIIAVITVPIILNIIENSRKGAATDSAYGYKDSINKYYVSELSSNKKLMLNGTYEVKANGVLNGNFGVGENAEDRTIPIDGTKPTSGKLRYSNNVLNGGCLVIGDYKITFKSDGSVDQTEKGDCDDYEFPSENSGSSSNEQGNGGQSSSVPTIASCPGCKFIFPTSQYYCIMGSDYDSEGGDYDLDSDMPPAADLTNDYRNLQKDVDIWIAGDNTKYYDESECYYANNETACEAGTTSVQRPYFLGLIESTSDSTKIGRAFACGIENDTPFCLEGYDPSKHSDDDNVGILNTIFPECGASASISNAHCDGSSVIASADRGGYVDVYDDFGTCTVGYYGDVWCTDFH